MLLSYPTMFGFLFMLVVSLSVIITAMETVPQFRQQIYTDEELKNISNLPQIFQHIDLENEKIKWSVNSFLVDWIYYLEICIFTFFTLEFIIHFAFCPDKVNFFCNFLNSLDAILCVCMWTILILYHIMDKNYTFMLSNKYTGYLFMISAFITALRLLKIFRLLKSFPGLHLLCMSIKSNLKDLVILFSTFISICCLFGIIIFVCEFNEKTTFPNVFIGIWWAVITMTTVGYGDNYPKSVPGYIVGMFCAIWGTVFLAMPIALLSSSFNDCFKRYNDRKRFQAYKNSPD
ncbi:hypothetical protein KUTeg_010669 [Tegillarca granosa]|uniref:Ion transport domain-containing protein n=1 Tax=Tegillarca granosa TaxID=220873 RepID=A0ABQ9F827_TEGGR|nr:hypothetical protein KUTeg_010669 [Tegillarca granosa]